MSKLLCHGNYSSILILTHLFLPFYSTSMAKYQKYLTILRHVRNETPFYTQFTFYISSSLYYHTVTQANTNNNNNS